MKHIRYIRFSGYLGNNLFQYAFGVYLRDVKGFDVVFLNSKGGKVVEGAITKFNCILGDPNHSLSEVKVFKFYCGVFYRFFRKVFQHFYWLSNCFVIERNLLNDKNGFKYKYYDGYWQDIRYVLPIASELIRHLTLKDETSLVSNPNVHLIKRCKNSVGVHVRRGDYASSRNHILLSMDYYNEAIRFMEVSVESPTFFIFTNDYEWVKSNFCFPNIVIINNEAFKNSDIVDFYCLSICKNNIIANSTFSWWSAFLNSNSAKIVVAPSKWSPNQDFDLKKIIPMEWILI